MDLFTSGSANMTGMAPSAWTDHPAAMRLMHLSVYMFPIVAVLSSIPVFSIVIKYNCIENGTCTRLCTMNSSTGYA
jgi:hypothetical protein